MTESVDSDEEMEERKWERHRRVKNIPHVSLVEYSQEFCIEDI